MSRRCYRPDILYKPEFAYTPVKGMRAESFVLPFSFNVLADGNPQLGYGWKLDDDTPWMFRAILFPQIGTAEGVNSGGSNLTGHAGLVRIRDTRGNLLTNCIPTDDFVLAVGAIGQSGFNAINASGFPFGCEIDCERGGVITFDFQIPQGFLDPGTYLTVAGTMIGAKLFEECAA